MHEIKNSFLSNVKKCAIEAGGQHHYSKTITSHSVKASYPLNITNKYRPRVGVVQ